MTRKSGLYRGMYFRHQVVIGKNGVEYFAKDFNLQPEVKFFYYSQLSKVFDFEISEKKTVQESGNDIFNIDVSIIRKVDKKVIQHIIYAPDEKGSFYGFDSCAISYSTGYKKKGDDYDIVVADFNFDGSEDIALKSADNNGHEQYEFYIQNKSGQFTKDKFLSSRVSGFIDTLDILNKLFTTEQHADVSSQGIQIFSYDILTSNWKVDNFNERMGEGIGKILDDRTGEWKTVAIRNKNTRQWEKVN